MSPLARPLRSATVLAALVALVAATAVSCGYVNPPVMTIAANSKDGPFFTLTWDDLDAKLNPAPASPLATTTTSKGAYKSSVIAQILTQTVQEETVNQLVTERKIVPTDADRAYAQKASSQGQSQSTGAGPTDFQVNVAALSRWAAEQAFASGELDKEEQLRQTFEANRAKYDTPAQVCVHGIFVLPNETGQPATEAELQAALATATQYRQRAATEDFVTLANEVNPERATQTYPDGDVGCVTQSEVGFDEAQWATLNAAAPGTVLDPMNLGDTLVLVWRVDEVKPAKEATLAEVRSAVEADMIYTIGQAVVGEEVRQAVAQYVVIVDPHYGVWDPENFAVNPPEGAATPTIPTTTTTRPGSLLPSTTIPSTTTTTAPATTGSTPGTTR